MTRTHIDGTASTESADCRPVDEHAAAARVFDRLTRTIIEAPGGRGRQRSGNTVVINDTSGDASPYAGSTTNVHMAENGRVLKVVALGRQNAANATDKPAAKAPASSNFSEGSVRASVAKAQLPDRRNA